MFKAILMVGVMFCIFMDEMYAWTMLFIYFVHDWDMKLCGSTQCDTNLCDMNLDCDF